MEVVELFRDNIETGRGHSSKGNQLKWEEDGYWYKADAFGYEGLAEVVVSRLLKRSNIENVAEYEPVIIRYCGKEYRGCRSRNFRGEKEELIPLERLARGYTGFSLAKQLAHIMGVKERIGYTEELVRNVTGIGDFGGYLAKMLEIDAFFLNEDRHTNNIALLYDTGKKEYRLCPFFDMGLSLFSDTREAYPLGKSFWECRGEIVSKPFDRDFDEQLDAANVLYGCHLKFDFPANRIVDAAGLSEAGCGTREVNRKMADKDKEGQNVCAGETGYTKQETDRVREILRYQAGKYQYLFGGAG